MSIQQGIHSGVDTYIDVNLQRYDSLLTHVTVSYTHLDVYKRQGIYFSSILLFLHPQYRCAMPAAPWVIPAYEEFLRQWLQSFQLRD